MVHSILRSYLSYFPGDKPLGDREMLLKKKRASTTDLSNNGDDQNLPDDDMGKFLKFLDIFPFWDVEFQI